MTTHNGEKIISLCQKGMKAEKQGNHEKAKELYERAWTESGTPYEACISAHFVARHQSLSGALEWNLESLRQAEQARNEEVETFYPSLYLCVGLSHEDLERYDDARKYVECAEDRMAVLHDDDYGRDIRERINQASKRLQQKYN